MVIETFGREISLFLGDPFLQPEMRLDDEFGHAFPLARERLSAMSSTHSMAFQNGRPGGVDVGHQLVGRLVAAVGVVALGEGEIGGGEFPGGDRPDVDPEPLEKCECVVEEQLQPCPRLVKVRPAEIAVMPVKLNRNVTQLIGSPYQLKAPDSLVKSV